MAITYTVNWETLGTGNTTAAITSTSRSYTSGDLIVVLYVNEGFNGALSISNSGTAQTWNSIASVGAIGTNCGVAGWWCVMSTTQTITITAADAVGSSRLAAIAVIPHQGFNTTTPVPSGNRFSGTSATDVSQSITPTASGSALWMLAGDFTASNTFTALANNTLDQTVHAPTIYTATLIRPTIQPRTDAAAFTIGETDTAGTIAWIAFEVQAAPATGGRMRLRFPTADDQRNQGRLDTPFSLQRRGRLSRW